METEEKLFLLQEFHNQTLKAMLKKAAYENGRDWVLLDSLSVRFLSHPLDYPLNLLYGRQV